MGDGRPETEVSLYRKPANVYWVFVQKEHPYWAYQKGEVSIGFNTGVLGAFGLPSLVSGLKHTAEQLR